MDIRLKIAAALGGAIFLGLASSGAQASDLVCGLSTGQAASGEPILIGAVVGRTGPDDFSSAAYAADAFFKCVNDNGGINGRPIQYLVEDDQWSPELSSQVAQKLVTDRKVVAMIANSSYVDCSANASFYQANGIVAVTGVGVPRECFEAPAIAPLNAGPLNSGIGMVRYAAQELGAKTVACIMPNIPNVGDWICEGLVTWGKEHGVEIKTYLVDPGTVDATSVLLQAMGDNPDTMLIGMSKNVSIPFMTAAEQQDLAERFKFVSLASLYSADVPVALGSYWDNRFYTNLEFNALDSTGADNQNWLAVMDKYADKVAPRDTFSQSGYLAARIAVDTLLKMDPANITRESVNEALSNVTDFQSDILCQPWYFDKTAQSHAANQGGPTAVSLEGKWQTIGGCPVLN